MESGLNKIPTPERNGRTPITVVDSMKEGLSKKKAELVDLQRTIQELKSEMLTTERFIGRQEGYDDSIHVQALSEKTKLMDSLVNQKAILESEIQKRSEELSNLELQASQASYNIFSSDDQDLSRGYLPDKNLPLQ